MDAVGPSEAVVVIGSSREQRIPSLVLEHTIRKHATGGVRVVHTWDRTFPQPRRPENRSRTGFSFARFSIPSIAGYAGLGAYLECDQIVFADVMELFRFPMGTATVLRPPNQASVMVLDCAHLRWDVQDILDRLDAGEFSYRDLMENVCVAPKGTVSCSLPNEWNSLEHYEAGRTRLLHFTWMHLQPWRTDASHPLGHLWFAELRDAVRAGQIRASDVEEDVRVGHIRPHVLGALR